MNTTQKIELNRSQKFFIDALLTLMQQKPYAEITITELSEYAQYDRRTFYRQFKSKDEVLCLHCATLLNEMASLMNLKGQLTPYSGFLSYFEFWSKHKDFLSLLHEHNLLNFLADRQEYLLYQYVGKLVHNDLPDSLSDTSEFSQYAFFFTLGGLWYSLVLWVRTGMKQSPEQLTEHILNSFTQMAELIAPASGS
ncbi:MAG: TetR/AcrR family transcriptional regulator [Lachnospiraceae bacterium]|nr:TetR/AcrR family transcriptional regulator [Lachnospiraceae bacterium]